MLTIRGVIITVKGCRQYLIMPQPLVAHMQQNLVVYWWLAFTALMDKSLWAFGIYYVQYSYLTLGNKIANKKIMPFAPLTRTRYRAPHI